MFILTSLWEGLPISLLEAMYMKKICIVSNCIGNRDVIENGINGFIAENKNDFTEIIGNNIVNNRKHVDRLINNAKEKVLKNYCNEVMVKEYKIAYLSK